MAAFTTNCTTPPYNVTFVSAPRIRGTLDIVWSCVTILIICTWSVLHLNVPEQTTPRNDRQRYIRTFLRGSVKLAWMIFNLFAPEWTFSRAWSDRWSVHCHTKGLKAFAEEDEVEWSQCHTYFANMGGFAIKFKSETSNEEQPTHETSLQDQPRNKVTKVFNFLSRQSGTIDWQTDKRLVSSIERSLPDREQCWFLCGDLWVLDAAQLVLARKEGIIEKLPSLSLDDLNDRNKQDICVKILAMIQVSWFMVQLGLRQYHQLSTTLLEIMVLAFACCTVISYILLWNKPNNVTYTIIIEARPPEPNEILALALERPRTIFGTTRGTIWIPNYAYHTDFKHVQYSSSLALIIFGSAHCIGWNFAFPTQIEQLMWRVSSIITAVAIPVAVLVDQATRCLPDYILDRFPDELWKKYANLVNTVCFVPFAAARVFILVEVFRSLAFLPPDAFFTTWVTESPHFG